MTAVSLSSSFPATVQPGIPKLGDKPDGWTRAPLGDFLREVRRPLKMVDDVEYHLVTVKRARGGVVDRGSFLGRDVLVKSQFLIEPGDFLISKRQIVHGACGIVPEELGGSIVSNEYAVLNGSEEIDLTFLNYLAHSIFFQQTCFHSSIGVHVEKMIFKLDRWLTFDFDLPPLPEQKKIAEILSTWDRAIEVSEALLATARKQKRALMQSLLTGKRRFPEFAGQEWTEVRLGDVVKITSGGTPSRKQPEFWGGAIPWVTTSEVNYTDIIGANETITDIGLNRSSAKLFPKGTVLLALYGQGKTRGQVGRLRIEAATNQACAALLDIKKSDLGFIYHRLTFDYLTLRNLANDGSQKNLSGGLLKSFSISIPTLDEQKRIANTLDAADSDIINWLALVEKLRTEKKALMQQLLTGKRRVVV